MWLVRIAGMSYFQYIDPRELAEIFQQDTVAIIDVRDEDFDENGSHTLLSFIDRM